MGARVSRPPRGAASPHRAATSTFPPDYLAGVSFPPGWSSAGFPSGGGLEERLRRSPEQLFESSLNA